MNARQTSKAFPLRYLTGMLAVCLFGSCLAFGQATKAKPAAKPAAPAAKPAAPAAKPATPAGGAAAGGAAKGPTTAGGAAKGPTTAGGAAKGPTTAGGAAKGPTTAAPAGRGAAAGPATGRGPAASPAGRGPASASRGGSPAGARGPARTASGHAAPAGHVTARNDRGAVTRDRNGKVRDVHDNKRGMDVHRGLAGGRSVRTERADGHRVVSERGGRGYVQSRYNYHGREYGHRTYYEHGRAYDRFYRGSMYHGVAVEVYAPSVYFAPAFYGWAYNPWVAPIPYAWGFAVNPWFGVYGGFFTPLPVYPSASVWLADYMISQSLAANYQAQVDAGQQPQEGAGAAPVTPDIQNMIAEEVKRQLALANSESQTVAQNAEPDPASSGIQRMLTDNIQHVFIAGKDLDLVDATGAECAVSEGDALQLSAPPAADGTAATLVVLASKGGVECKKGATVAVEVADLQDMQNHMRETIDAGLGDLQTKQGKGGLPTLPAAAKAAPTKAPFAQDAPPPDPQAAAQITGQLAEADKAEAEVTSAPATGGPSDTPAAAPAPPEPPKTIALGQTIDEVIANLGQPKTIVDLGNKKRYVYKDMKITFTGGKVTDIE
jgi:hypothetical protein